MSPAHRTRTKQEAEWAQNKKQNKKKQDPRTRQQEQEKKRDFPARFGAGLTCRVYKGWFMRFLALFWHFLALSVGIANVEEQDHRTRQKQEKTSSRNKKKTRKTKGRNKSPKQGTRNKKKQDSGTRQNKIKQSGRARSQNKIKQEKTRYWNKEDKKNKIPELENGEQWKQTTR